jgi:hypothetical protein
VYNKKQMAETFEPQSQKTRPQSSHAAEEIRVNELAALARNENIIKNDDLGTPLMPSLGARNRDRDRSASLPKGIMWGVAGLVIIFIGGFAVSYYVIRHEVASVISSRASALQVGVQDLQNFNLQSAEQEFSSANNASLASPSGILSVLGSFFSGSSGAIGAFSDLSGQLSTLTNNLSNMQNDAWSVVAGAANANSTSSASNASGANVTSTPFITDLKGMQTALAAIDADTDKLSGFSSILGSAGLDNNGGNGNGGITSAGNSDSYLALKTQVQRAENFLNAFVPWFSDASTTHHVLVLLENPSEMRPGGGFLGSYADVAIHSGTIESISVHDVADVNAAFAQKIIPPKPLQLEEAGWRPADGNWFFDFPTSASATISLFEKSALYANTSTTFDGVIAVTPQTMSDLLSVTGPMTIANATVGITPANGSTTFSSSSLVTQIQAIVQAGQAKTSTGVGASTYPKKVLDVLWSSVLGKLASSTSNQQQQILGLAAGWIANKDAMAYFKNADFENFITTYGAAGDEFVPPQNFNGDYLAIVNTDVNSDKSELYVSSTVNINISIGSDGLATDHLVITRAHHGNQSPSWWYQTSSQDYMQVFVPAGSSLINENGGFVKTISAPINYAQKGYAADPLFLALDSNTKQSFAYPAVSVRAGTSAGGSGGDIGKEIFSVWSRTYKGSSTQVTFDYTHQLFSLPADGVQYQFVFERQSGAVAHYQFEIDAPLGYVFAENGLASYVYDETTMPGRLAITLTLQKI